MNCSNPDCNKKKPEGFLGKLFGPEGVIRNNKWYCDEHCYKHPVLKEYVLRKGSNMEMRTSVHPITSRSFGATLVSLGKINAYQLDRAMLEKKSNGNKPLAHYLMAKGLITKKDVIEALAKLHKVPVVYVGDTELNIDNFHLIPHEVAKIGKVIPISFSKLTGKLALLMTDPSDLTTILTVKKLSNLEVEIYQGDPEEIQRLTEFYYTYIKAVQSVETRAEARIEMALAHVN